MVHPILTSSFLTVAGFLSTANEYSPGNYGMLDLTMALKWVYDNIYAFNGNKDLITVYGPGSGAAAAGLLAIAPATKHMVKQIFGQVLRHNPIGVSFCFLKLIPKLEIIDGDQRLDLFSFSAFSSILPFIVIIIILFFFFKILFQEHGTEYYEQCGNPIDIEMIASFISEIGSQS